MNLLTLYQETIEDDYITIEEDVSFKYHKDDNGTLHIFFEKSDGATDWKNNLDFFAKPYSDMPYTWYAHRGFVKVWKIAREILKYVILDISVKSIIISGYSHGAALALLCHEYCVFNRPDIKVESYGYGCPRVVWGKLPREVRERFKGFHVIRNKKDIVTHVPPSIFGYKHVGELITVGRGKKNCIDSHRPESYLEALEAYMRRCLK